MGQWWWQCEYIPCKWLMFFQTTVSLTSLQVELTLSVKEWIYMVSWRCVNSFVIANKCDSIGSCSMLSSIPSLPCMMQLLMLLSTSPTLCVVHALRIYVLTSLERLWHGWTRPILRKLRQYLTITMMTMIEYRFLPYCIKFLTIVDYILHKVSMSESWCPKKR